jgi:hypothetical protein
MGGFCNSMAYYSIAYMAYNSIAQLGARSGQALDEYIGAFRSIYVHGNVNGRVEKTNLFLHA